MTTDTGNDLVLYNRTLCLYDNVLKNNDAHHLVDQVTIKAVAQIRANNKDAIQTSALLHDFQSSGLIAEEKDNSPKYLSDGVEYQYVLNDFYDLKKIIEQETDHMNLGRTQFLKPEIFKASVIIFKLFYGQQLENGQVVEMKMNEDLSDYNSEATHSTQADSMYYLEIKGFCHSRDLKLYSLLIQQFSKKFQGIGNVVFMKSSQNVIIQ